MALLPLSLGVTRFSSSKGVKGASSFSSGAAADETSLRQEVLVRDKNTCRYCGFTAGKYQQIYFPGGGKRAKDAVTACIYCHQCFTLC